MNVLIVSRTPWNIENSFGNTFSNLFQKMSNVKIYHICCQKGQTNLSLAESTYQMTDASVAKSILGKKVGQRLSGTNNKYNKPDSSQDKKGLSWKRLTIFFIARDIIWKIGKWKQCPDLVDFLKEAKPDIVYLPIYSSIYMCDVQNYIINCLNVPVVGHISDDVYSYPKGFLASPLTLFYRFVLRKKIRNIIQKTSYLEVFAQNMKEEYEKIFHKKCYLIGKGVDVSVISNSYQKAISSQHSKKYVYTGNLGDERWKVLCGIARALEQQSKDSTLDVYSSTPLSPKMLEAFNECSCLQFKGNISYGEVQEQQRRADVLVHVESFSPKAIYSTRMSFSTKIIDYMVAGKTIIAVGPEKVNSISFLKNYRLAFVALREQDIPSILKNINNVHEIRSVQNNVREYLKNERNIKKIQLAMYERMYSICNNE